MSNALDRVRAAALELPETEERVSHGQPTFFVAGKQFAQFRDNHHGDERTVVCVRTSGLDEQVMLLESDPETYSKPAYLHHAGWVSINLAEDTVDWDHVADRIAESWELAAPRRLLEAGGR
ncbi:MAG TPA: MmcQ/YjbR family DNA-binding protein [Sphingomicrobium sp.]|nr:MmcQ/YjbR family DNA-binding protein [Sphingomicrobium sp.]